MILTTNGQLATAQLRSTLARLDFDPPCLIASQDQHMWHIKNKIDSGHVTHPFWWDKTRFTLGPFCPAKGNGNKWYNVTIFNLLQINLKKKTLRIAKLWVVDNFFAFVLIFSLREFSEFSRDFFRQIGSTEKQKWIS